jgi:hypothetical protein
MIAPEALISCLLCERMQPNEAIIIMGAQQYAKYSGYGDTFTFESEMGEQAFERFVLFS